MISRTFLKILEELNWPPIFLTDPKQFAKVDGVTMEGSDGLSNTTYSIISIRKGLRGRLLKNVLYHEIAHILFPHRPHWWIECAAERLAGGGGRGWWSIQYGYTVDMMPTRSNLLKMFRKASEKLSYEKHNRKKPKRSTHGRCH